MEKIYGPKWQFLDETDKSIILNSDSSSRDNVQRVLKKLSEPLTPKEIKQIEKVTKCKTIISTTSSEKNMN